MFVESALGRIMERIRSSLHFLTSTWEERFFILDWRNNFLFCRHDKNWKNPRHLYDMSRCVGLAIDMNLDWVTPDCARPVLHRPFHNGNFFLNPYTFLQIRGEIPKILLYFGCVYPKAPFSLKKDDFGFAHPKTPFFKKICVFRNAHPKILFF